MRRCCATGCLESLAPMRVSAAPVRGGAPPHNWHYVSVAVRGGVELGCRPRRRLKGSALCPLCRMRKRVDLFELGDGDVRVDLGGGELRVAQDRLYEADVGAVLEHVSGHRVAEQMRSAGLIDTGGA